MYNDYLSRLGGLHGPPLLEAPSSLVTVLRRELHRHAEASLGWEAVANDGLLALLHPHGAGGHRLEALMFHPDSHQTYVLPPPEQPRPGWEDLIAAFHDHVLLPTDTWHPVGGKTLSRDYRLHVRARPLDLRDFLCQR